MQRDPYWASTEPEQCCSDMQVRMIPSDLVLEILLQRCELAASRLGSRCTRFVRQVGLGALMQYAVALARSEECPHKHVGIVLTHAGLIEIGFPLSKEVPHKGLVFLKNALLQGNERRSFNTPAMCFGTQAHRQPCRRARASLRQPSWM